MIHADNLVDARPQGDCGIGVLVLAGSSGRVDTARVDLLARSGARARGLRWFGGPGLSELPVEVPLELFAEALDPLVAECDRVAVVGVSYGAEAALHLAARDLRIDVVVAIAPTDVAWEGQATLDDDPRRSKWTWRGVPLPFVAIDRQWQPAPGKPAFVELYELSREAAGPDVVAAATIPTERIGGELVLVAGGDDQVWNSLGAARRIEARRRVHGLDTALVVDALAGHQLVLPGERAPKLIRPYEVGGDPGSAFRIGELAWPAIADALGLPVRAPSARSLP